MAFNPRRRFQVEAKAGEAVRPVLALVRRELCDGFVRLLSQ